MEGEGAGEEEEGGGETTGMLGEGCEDLGGKQVIRSKSKYVCASYA